MDYLIVLVVAIALTSAFLVWAVTHWLRTRRTARDDLVRAGDSGRPATPYEASRRAEGEAAWTRISGGA